MAPEHPTGSMIFGIEPVAGTLSVGDVVTFRKMGEAPVTHRIVDVVATNQGPRYITQGDANNVPDAGWVKPDEVLARITFGLPVYGYLKVAVLHPLGILFLVWPPAFLLAYLEVRRLADASVAAWQHKRARADEPDVRRIGRDARPVTPTMAQAKVVRVIRRGGHGA